MNRERQFLRPDPSDDRALGLILCLTIITFAIATIAEDGIDEPDLSTVEATDDTK